MINKESIYIIRYILYTLYIEKRINFTNLNRISYVKRTRAHIKLTYKIDNFNLLIGVREGC
jgi:hypothetical protein